MDDDDQEAERLAEEEGAGEVQRDADEQRNQRLQQAGERERTSDQDRARGEAKRSTEAYQEYSRRRAKEIIHPEADSMEIPKAADVIARARTLGTELESYHETLEMTHKTAKERKEKNLPMGKANIDMIDAYRGMVEQLLKQNNSRIFALEQLDANGWEQGDLPPREFLRRFRAYLNDIGKIDDDEKKHDHGEREERREAREKLYEETAHAVETALKTMPSNMPQELVQKSDPTLTDEEIWQLYLPAERKRIVESISLAAGMDALKLSMNDDIETLQQVIAEKKIKETILAQQRAVIEAGAEAYERSGSDGDGDEFLGMNPLEKINAIATSINQKLGIEWLTYNEWKAAFTEVIESIKEVRKRKSIGRITRAALQIGRVASYIPGAGGEDLVTVLEEQQQKKNDEIKDDFKKELGDTRKDFGFRDLFGGGGKPGLLKTYLNLHDTNRTRSIIEFAAGKGMLYDIDSEEWDKYELPGGVRFRDALPSEWNDSQVSSYYENMQFANRQGSDAAQKAGETLVKGRSSFDGYTKPFAGSVKGMSLWFAKGIANEALKKVKNGHMSSMLTLIVLHEWETNEQFRKYAPAEWFDRLSGDHKQMNIGMIKYDQGHLIAGARNPGYITHDLAKATAKPRFPGDKPKPRLGPYVTAIKQYLIAKDPSLKNDDVKLTEFTAKVMASNTVKLDNGKMATVYSPELASYQIEYQPNEMRGANVAVMGDDHFIERSEIIHGTVEVMKSVGAVNQEGFAFGEKARYYFSHIIDNYVELDNLAQNFESSGKKKEAEEMRASAEQFKRFINPQLNEWIKEAIAGNGGKKLVNVQHAKQDGRYLLLTLMRTNLVSVDIIEKMDQDGNGAAKALMKSYRRLEKETVAKKKRRAA